jgi:hypothetical protein
MGYTHYYEITRDIPENSWMTFLGLCRKICDARRNDICWESNYPTEPPELTPATIRFNGRGDNSHETFLLDRYSRGFTFCKTARKPYDDVVTAILLAAHYCFGDDIEISSDGYADEWGPGQNLLAEVCNINIADEDIKALLEDS